MVAGGLDVAKFSLQASRPVEAGVTGEFSNEMSGPPPKSQYLAWLSRPTLIAGLVGAKGLTAARIGANQTGPICVTGPAPGNNIEVPALQRVGPGKIDNGSKI
jgi:hypothetical protein